MVCIMDNSRGMPDAALGDSGAMTAVIRYMQIGSGASRIVRATRLMGNVGQDHPDVQLLRNRDDEEGSSDESCPEDMLEALAIR